MSFKVRFTLEGKRGKKKVTIFIVRSEILILSVTNKHLFKPQTTAQLIPKCQESLLGKPFPVTPSGEWEGVGRYSSPS